MKAFNPEKELKRLNRKFGKRNLIIGIFAILIALTIGSSYAIFSITKQSHVILSGAVGEFTTKDIQLAVLIDGEKQDTFPEKSSGYIFDSLTCENGTTGIWDSNSWNIKIFFKGPDKCTVSFTKSILLADYIKNNVYVSDGINGLYYHDGQGTYTNADQEAGDNSYRYSGANPNNYICFGSDASPCPEDNLYRIIGVFGNNVKLIKATLATKEMLGTNGTYSNGFYKFSNISSCPSVNTISNNYLSSSMVIRLNGLIAALDSIRGGCNDWTISELNTINLNVNFINSLNSKWQDIIISNHWRYAGIDNGSETGGYTKSAKLAFTKEFSNNSAYYISKIGLMYISDYGYANIPEFWSSNLASNVSSVNTDDNWIYSGFDEWTISVDNTQYPRSEYNNAFSFLLISTMRGRNAVDYYPGSIFGAETGSVAGVRPVFYLNSDVEYKNGDGSKDNPFRIN